MTPRSWLRCSALAPASTAPAVAFAPPPPPPPPPDAVALPDTKFRNAAAAEATDSAESVPPLSSACTAAAEASATRAAEAAGSWAAAGHVTETCAVAGSRVMTPAGFWAYLRQQVEGIDHTRLSAGRV